MRRCIRFCTTSILASMILSSSSILATPCDAADDPSGAQAASSRTESGSPLPPSLAELERIVLRGAHFDFGKADIKPAFEPVLNAAARILQQHPDVRVTITGHTDAIGTDEYNQRLSERRAEAVKQYLVSRGVAAERLGVVSKGRSEPLVPSRTSDGKDNPDARAINRRVELRIQQ